MDKQIDKVIQHIKDLENRLGYVDNNLRYIKVIQEMCIRDRNYLHNGLFYENWDYNKGIYE